eukprot:8697756-Karenia_brevis.AAC.1
MHTPKTESDNSHFIGAMLVPSGLIDSQPIKHKNYTHLLALSEVAHIITAFPGPVTITTNNTLAVRIPQHIMCGNLTVVRHPFEERIGHRIQ